MKPAISVCSLAASTKNGKADLSDDGSNDGVLQALSTLSLGRSGSLGDLGDLSSRELTVSETGFSRSHRCLLNG